MPDASSTLSRDVEAAKLVHLRQRCKACGRPDPFDFSIPDSVWEAVVPSHLRCHVVCLECFDRLAKAGGVNYAPHIRQLYFVGAAAVIEFAVKTAAPLRLR